MRIIGLHATGNYLSAWLVLHDVDEKVSIPPITIYRRVPIFMNVVQHILANVIALNTLANVDEAPSSEFIDHIHHTLFIKLIIYPTLVIRLTRHYLDVQLR